MLAARLVLLLALALIRSAVAAPLVDPLAGDRWGHEPYADASPLDVAVSPLDGRIYVADASRGRVVELSDDFAPTGRVLDAPGVTGVDVAADGWLAIVSLGPAPGAAPRVTLVPPAGEPIIFGRPGTEPGELNKPCGVTFGPAGNVFVFDTFNQRVQVFDRSGQPLMHFGEYEWTRTYRSQAQKKQVTEQVKDRLYRPVRGDFLPDSRLIVADYDGPVIDPELGRRGGMFSVWRVDVAARTASFEKFAQPDNPFPDFKAGDVCVDRRTGEIYTVESDFPLTDHDFVRVADSVDEPPKFSTKFAPHKFLTHPRGVALAKNGDVIVAEADKGVAFAIPASLMDTPSHVHNPLEWPKVIRHPVCEPNRIAIEYRTLTPTPTKVQYAPVHGWYDYPDPPPTDGLREITSAGRDRAWRPLAATQPGMNHRAELTELTPATRYAWRYVVTERAYPAPLWSETYLATTAPPADQTQYLDAEVIVLVFTNLVTPPPADQTPQPADPGPMTPEQIEALKRRMEFARRFYWINSRGKFNLRFTYVLDSQRYDPAPVHNWGYWPHDDHRKIEAILAEHGVKHADMAGLCAIYGYRHWDATTQSWELSGSGGNTWGSCHDGSAINTINAGGDTAWLFVHEYGHSMGINYEYSGQLYQFNHFHWNFLPTDYGAHYDGMAAICREFKDVAYWSNRYGRLATSADRDGDGLIDDDPNVPLDEARFGSDPNRVDTDGDGLTDFEEMLATAGLARYERAFEMRQVEPVFEPDPTNPDADRDGVRDGDDRYPLYPWSTAVQQADVTVDGRCDPNEWPQAGFVRVMEDPEMRGAVRVAWSPTHLYLCVQQRALGAESPVSIYCELDCNNDGQTVGADNLELWFEPLAGGAVNVRTKHNDTVLRLRPTWTENILPNPEDVVARWGRAGDCFALEIALPQTRDAGLELRRFEELGLLMEFYGGGLPGRLRLFEPQSHFDLELR